MASRGLVQYVVLRGDLRREPLSWPLGALVAQACHAALAVVHAHYAHADTAAYLAQGGGMRTVVLEVQQLRLPASCALCASPRITCTAGGRGRHFCSRVTPLLSIALAVFLYVAQLLFLFYCGPR